ncbi:MAG: hypothetical protein HYS13_22430 [Planctomycetia bacterium]|nr:hypothetical protein [Planctomycetia bacterium]
MTNLCCVLPFVLRRRVLLYFAGLTLVTLPGVLADDFPRRVEKLLPPDVFQMVRGEKGKPRTLPASPIHSAGLAPFRDASIADRVLTVWGSAPREYLSYASSGDFAVQFPNETKPGDVLAMLGPPCCAVYRFSAASYKFERIPEAELDEDLRVIRAGYAVPVGCCGRLHTQFFDVTEIRQRGDGSREPAATLVIHPVRVLNVPEAPPRKVTVAAGDNVTFGTADRQATYEVLRVVPQDAKRQVVGWVEFNPFPRLETKLQAQPDELTVERAPRSKPRNDPTEMAAQHRAWLDRQHPATGAEGGLNLRVQLALDRLSSKDLLRLPMEDFFDYRTYYLDFKPGDVVPLLGPLDTALYCVQTVETLANDQRKMTFKKVADAKAYAAIRPGRESYCIPLRGAGQMQRHEILVKEIMPADAGAKPPVAKIELPALETGRLTYRKVEESDLVARELTVRAGDILELKHTRHKVLRVVAPDPERQIVGWVELDPFPVKDDRKPLAEDAR